MNWITFWRRAFYTLAFVDILMAEYVRWFEDSRPEAGYWLSRAIIAFLIGYILFTPCSTTHRKDR